METGIMGRFISTFLQLFRCSSPSNSPERRLKRRLSAYLLHTKHPTKTTYLITISSTNTVLGLRHKAVLICLDETMHL